MILFKPTGTLNIATESTDIPEQSDGNNSISIDMQRCKNLSTKANGKAVVRKGSTRINNTALSGQPNFLIVQDGYRYSQFGSVIYKDEISIKTGVTNAQGFGVRYKSFNEVKKNVFYTNGTDQYRIEDNNVYQWGISAPNSVPTVATSGASALTGTYYYKITYARLSGSTVISESNPSSESASITVALDGIQVSWTASSDEQVTHVRIYRTLANGLIYYYVASVAIGTTSYVDTAIDGSLGDLLETDHTSFSQISIRGQSIMAFCS